MVGEGAGAGMLSSLSAPLSKMKMAKEGDLQTKSPEFFVVCFQQKNQNQKKEERLKRKMRSWSLASLMMTPM